MDKIRVGIIGVGNMGTTHCRNIYEGKIPDMTLAAAADISEARRNYVSENFPGTAVFSDGDEMLKSGLIDLVIIAIPHYFHAEYAIRALDLGLHVITEKPAGVYTKQVKEMNAAAAAHPGQIFGIMYNQRTNPMYQKLREMVKSGELGSLKRVTWIITD